MDPSVEQTQYNTNPSDCSTSTTQGDDDNADDRQETVLGFCQVFIKEEHYDEEDEGELDELKDSEPSKECSTAVHSDSACYIGAAASGQSWQDSEKSRPTVTDTDSPILQKRKLDKCGHCSYSTTDSRDLMRHFSSNHADQYPFVCDFCDFRCLERKTLKTHNRDQHPDEKRFSCELCSYKSSRQVDFKRHLVAHSDQKPFFCEFCDFKTSYQSNLKAHLRNHTDERPFSCEFCEYRARFAGNLKTHLRTHTGDKLYSCEFCDYKTSFSGNLKKHLKTHSRT